MNKLGKFAAASAVVLCAFGAEAATYYVGKETGDKASIDEALAAVAAAPDAAGDEIVVRTGTYEAPVEYVLSSAITIRGATGKPEDVIIKATGTHRGFTLNHEGAKVSGVTIQGAKPGAVDGGGVYIGADGGTLANCVVRSCETSGGSHPGGGVYIAANAENGLVDCCVISNCVTYREGTTGGGTALGIWGGEVRSSLIVENNEPNKCGSQNDACSVIVNGGRLVNCTVARNFSYTSPGVRAMSGLILNCIIAENRSETSMADYATYVGNADCFSNCVAAVKINDSCLVMEHPFRDSANGDYSPVLGTVGVDHGLAEDWMSSATDFKGNPRASGSAPDAGAIEYDQRRFSAQIVVEPNGTKVPMDVTFNATVVGATGALSYAWDLDGDGTFETETAEPTASKAYAEAAHVMVGLRVTDSSGSIVVHAPVKAFGDEIRVVKGNANAAPPYDTWANAAATLETAYDYAVDGTTIVVSNGTHETSAQMLIRKAVTIRGLTGRPEDVIVKAKGTHRMFWLCNPDAKITGLTIRDGNSGAYSRGGGVFVDVPGGTLENCVVHSCRTTSSNGPGGGVYIAPKADLGLVDCCVISNCYTYREGNEGGGTALGVWGGVARSCLITENVEPSRCGSQNTAGSVIVNGGRLVNCTVTRNHSYSCPGVWAKKGWVVNCIIVKNTSAASTDGAYLSFAGDANCFSNCIAAAKINDTCFAMDDPFVDFNGKDYTVALGTKPVDFGVKEDWMADALDLAGNPRLSGEKPDAGAYEADQSKFSAGIIADVQSGFAPLKVKFTVTAYNATGAVTCYWDWDGDGKVDETTNNLEVWHEFTTEAVHSVRLTIKDESGQSYSLADPLPIRVMSKYIYVSTGSPNPAAPYDSWTTAAHTVEEAVAIAIEGSEIVVSNGTHDIAAEVQLLTGVTIRGFTGRPEDVILRMKSGTTHRLFLLSNADAKVSSLTIQGGRAGANPGGGVFIGGGTLHNCIVRSCETSGSNNPGGGVYLSAEAVHGLVDCCVISNCCSYREGGYGGGTALGVWGGVVRNSLITENIEPSKCGSQNTAGSVIVNGGRLVNCTVTRNHSYSCPGVWAMSGEVVNCIIAENTSAKSTDGAYVSYAGKESCFSHCIAAAKINDTCHAMEHPFFDSSQRDYSPVVGTVAVDGGLEEDWMAAAKDLVGNDRLSGEAPDIGAIEFDQSQLSVGYVVDPAAGKAPLTVTFTAKALGATGDVTYEWDLDGDGTFETTTTDPILIHTFDTPVSVAVGLKVVDDGVAPSAEAVATAKTTVRAFGKAIHVSETSENPAEPYDSWTNAANDVVAALSIACDGCEIVVSNGTYDIATEQQMLKDVTISGLTGDWRDVTLRSKANSGNHRLFWMDHANARIQGVTLCGASGKGNGAGVYIDAHGGTLYRCAITNCTSLTGGFATSGGGVYIASGADSARVDSCLFRACKSGHEGGNGGAAISMSAGLAINCIVKDCDMENPGGNPANCGSVRVTGGTFAHGIVVGNKSKVCPGVWATGGEVVNCVIGDNSTLKPETYNTCWVGTASLFKNCLMDIASPLPESCETEAPTDTFRNYEAGDYRLKSTSKGVDGGVKRSWMEGATDFRGSPRKMGRLPDCGIYETGGGLAIIVR